MTSTILLAQEFGANLGHITRLLAVARVLGPQRYVLAVPDADVARPVVAKALGPEVEVVGGMRYHAPLSACTPSVGDRTLADVFFNLGYAHRDSVRAAARRWSALVERVRPDLIISDFAPTLRVAVGGRVPFLAIGSGYETPPPDRDLPPIAVDPVNDVSRWREARLLETAQAVRSELDGPPLACFADVYQGDRVFTLVPPGCDPYEALRVVPTYAPVVTPGMRCGPDVRRRTGPEIFLFMWSDHPAIDVVLTALNGLPCRSEIHIRGVDPARIIAQCGPQMGIRPESADFMALLPQTRLFIHYGGGGASYAGLLAGTAQLILPIFLEQEVNARGMMAQGVALGAQVSRGANPEQLRSVIAGLLGNQAMQAAALTAAPTWARRKLDPLPAIVAASRDMTGDRSLGQEA